MSDYKRILLYICFLGAVESYSYNILHKNVSHSRISRNVQQCLLPQHPKYGQWHIHQATSQPNPGTFVPPGSILEITCQNQYKLDGVAVIVCFNGKWSTEIGECIKTCPPLYNTPVMTVSCTYNHRKLRNCVDALDGTVAKFRCADFYEDQSLERYSRHVCYNGKWRYNIPECVPICGQKNVRGEPTSILGGINVTKGEYPWQIAIYDKQSKNLLCGGSLINQRVVLTAAHCITDAKAKLKSKELFEVAAGKYYRNYDDPRDANETQFSSIFEMYMPKQYKADVQNYFADIAVIITKKTFLLSTRVQPVCVDWAFRQDYFTNSAKTQRSYVTGWGYTVEYEKPSEVLKELQVPLITEEVCKRGLPEDYVKYMTDDKLCAGYLETGLSVCKGDSGGGLVTRCNGRFYIIGVVSITPLSLTHEGGCDSQQYSLYTNVSYFIDSFLLNIEARFRPSISHDLDCEDDPHCNTEPFTTLQPRIQIPKEKCILPEHPDSGKWIIFGSQSKHSPGMTVSTGTILQISCEQNHKLTGGQERILCNNQGKWSPQIGTCLKTCPPLFSNEIISITCTFGNNQTDNCKEPVEGTVAKYQCTSFYESSQMAQNLARVCRNGSWNLKKPECIPVCGSRSATTIFSPWHVTFYEKKSKNLTCNGALISQRVIVTAAQCVTTLDGKKNPKEDLVIAVGKYYSDFENSEDTEAQFSDVEEIFLPEHYKGLKNYFVADIAVLVTKRPFKLSQKVQPICIDRGLKYDLNRFDNGHISGWEYTQPNSTLKLSNNHPIVKNDQCRDALSENCERLFLTFDKICIGFLNNSSFMCKSDAGIAGAALVTNPHNRHHLAGVASIIPHTSENECDKKKYALFTKVSQYIDFILKVETQYK